MKKRIWSIALALPFLLGGCFWQSVPVQPVSEPQPLTAVPLFMIANEPGATSVVEDEAFGGEVRVSLDETFTSAAGETCKRATLLSARHEAEIVVVCHDPSVEGEWRLMPRVWGRGL